MAERKRAEAHEFRRVAGVTSLLRDREWCLREAERLDKAADELEGLTRKPTATASGMWLCALGASLLVGQLLDLLV